MKSKTMKKNIVLAAAVAAGTLLASSTALADGLIGKAADLAVKDRAALQKAVTADRAQHPEAYEAVRNVQGYKPETYKKFRNPIPLVGRELRRLGKPALLPMLEALALDVWARDGATDAEWNALKVGMLEAVAYLGDSRSAAVVELAFAEAHAPEVERAAAEAVGALCATNAQSLNTLVTALEKPNQSAHRRMAAARGLGQCRVQGAADALARALGEATTAGEVEVITLALGNIGSSWAWRAIERKDKARAAEGLEVRRIATEALVKGFLRFDGEPRRRHQVALSMVQHPEIRSIAEAHRAGADASSIEALDRVVTMVEKRARR